MNAPAAKQRPSHLVRCFFCGRNSQIHTSDPFFLETQGNGRSFNFCKRHWRELRRYAPVVVIKRYQRLRLPHRKPTLQKVITDLKLAKGDLGLV